MASRRIRGNIIVFSGRKEGRKAGEETTRLGPTGLGCAARMCTSRLPERVMMRSGPVGEDVSCEKR